MRIKLGAAAEGKQGLELELNHNWSRLQDSGDEGQGPEQKRVRKHELGQKHG